jgi:hypothetical protein
MPHQKAVKTLALVSLLESVGTIHTGREAAGAICIEAGARFDLRAWNQRALALAGLRGCK